MDKMNAKKKREIIVKALKSCNTRLTEMEGSTNPQVREMWTRNKGYAYALEDVLLLLDGNAVNINCLIG